MLERISVQGVQFAIGIVLARILSPSEYGVIGLLTVIIAFLQVFVDGGFSKALIQKQNRTQIDLDTVFYFNVFISFCSYIFLWIVAPYISMFYQDETLTSLMRVLSFLLLLNAIFSVPITLLTIDMNFKSIARINLTAVFLSGIIGIIMAYNGYGVWALVWQIIFKSIMISILVWNQVKWKPQFKFSIISFSSLWPYGSKILISSILNMLVNNFSNIFIAKLSSTKDLGFYTRGTQFADIFFTTFSTVLESVLLPFFATVQNDLKELIKFTRLAIKSSALILVPIFFGMAILSEPLIKVILTDKWLMAIPIMQIFCIARLISIISGINVSVLYAVGRTDLALKQQYIKLIVRIVFISLALKYGIMYIALAELISTLVNFFINTYYSGKLLKYGGIDQMKDLLFIIVSSFIMIFLIYVINSFIISDGLKLLLSPAIGFFIYMGLLYFLSPLDFNLLISNWRISLAKIKN